MWLALLLPFTKFQVHITLWKTALFSEARRGFPQTVYIRILHVTGQETITLPCVHVHIVHSR